MKTYPLGETPSMEETGGAPFKERFVSASLMKGASRFGSVKTGEFRTPKRGEWYLSGAIPQAYKAPNDLTTPYHILKLVRVTIQHYEYKTVTPVTKTEGSNRE